MDAEVNIVALTATIVSSFVSKNPLPSQDLPQLIKSVHATLVTLGNHSKAPTEPLVPSVPIKRSVLPDQIHCLEDGKAFRSLKRHLSTHHKLTPEQYRTKWGLPSDYPMVAPNYAATRSSLAKRMGLGRRSKAAKRRRAGS